MMKSRAGARQQLHQTEAARLYKKLGFEELGYNQFTLDK